MTTPDRPAAPFTYRRARSGGLLGGLLMALGVETAALHLWLHTNHAALAWALTLSSATVMAWLLGDYRAMGRGALTLSRDCLILRVGWRVQAEIPLSNIAAAQRVNWRDLPARSGDYLNAMRPTEPSVVLTLLERASVRLPGGVRRAFLTIGIAPDDPDGFVAAMSERRHVN